MRLRLARGLFHAPGDDAVRLHVCDLADTTAYVEYTTPAAPPKVLANDPRADIDGFVEGPISGALDAVYVTAERVELVPLTEAGHSLKTALERVRQALRLGLKSSPVQPSPVKAGLATGSQQAATAESSQVESSQVKESPATADDDMTLQVMLTSRTRTDDVWVVRATSDVGAATFYLLEDPYGSAAVAAPSPPRRLLCARPALLSLPLVPMEAVTVPARDGEWLTLALTSHPHPHPHLSPLTSHLSPLTSHLSPLTANRKPQTPNPKPRP